MEELMTRQTRILVVDDEESMREVLTIMLHDEGYQVEAVSDGLQAFNRLQEQDFDLVISDMKMPRLDGMELLQRIKEQCPDTVVIMITAFSSTEDAVLAMRQGAYDYITKPFKNDEIRLIVKNALERKALQKENKALKKELGQRYSFGNLIGKSRAMQQIFELVKKVAGSRVNILVTGESGTGKELVARAIHFNGEFKDRPFVAVNCGAIPENLLESELFGHEKGSFTGAFQQKAGLFEVADSGTIFLDEIGELPPMMQVKLLRVIQEREFRRVGGTKNQKVNVHLIVATNKDLEREVAEGRFREDLYYRLNVIKLNLPSLRERREDIPLLVEHFYQKYAGKSDAKIPSQTMKRLLDYAWPGNVRELENVIERCLVLEKSGEISLESLPPHIQQQVRVTVDTVDELPPEGLDLDQYLADIETRILVKALERCGGVRKKAAELLGISFRSIRYRLQKLGIEESEES